MFTKFLTKAKFLQIFHKELSVQFRLLAVNQKQICRKFSEQAQFIDNLLTNYFPDFKECGVRVFN